MKKNGYSDYTIQNYRRALNTLKKYCNLNKPETVKSFLATLEGTHGYKKQLVFAYDKYVKTYGLTWERPKYIPRRKMPRIPQEAKINYIIANASPKLRTAISISKDTGLRPIELMRLKLIDIDLEKRAAYPETAKHGNPRVLKITEKTLHMLTEYIGRANIKLNQKIFANWKPIDYSKYFRATRNKTAKKIGDCIYVRDLNNSPCVTAKKTEVTKEFPQLTEIEIAVIVREIEGWYLAGLNENDSENLGINQVIQNTDNITKNKFNRLIPRGKPRIEFMQQILNNYKLETAKGKNGSLNYFLVKWTQ